MSVERIDIACGVCVRVDKDDSIKSCRKCTPCGEWICDRCWTDPIRRGTAAGKKLVQNVSGTLKKVAGLLDKQPKVSLPLQGGDKKPGWAPSATVIRRT